jgi:Zn-dependent peptidase ImmA (M78 family)
MSTPLQEQLIRRSISNDALIKVGISGERADELLRGADPTIAEVRKISSVLKIPIRSLVIGKAEVSGGKYRLRENFKSSLDRDYEIFDLLSRAETLASVLSSREHQRAVFEIGPAKKSFEVAEELAQICRRDLLKSDTIAPLIDLETRVAAFTSAHVLISNQRNLEGSVIISNRNAFIFLSPRPDPRMRFTLAHELCHYLVDLPSEETGGWFDEDVLSSGNRIDERFANSFASALLLPPVGVGEVLKAFRTHHKLSDQPTSDYEIMFIAVFFGVSFQVAARRLEDLRILPSGAGQSLYENIISRFGSPEKLAERLALPEREIHPWGGGCRLLLIDVRDAIAEGKISIGRLAEIIEMPVEQISQLASQ